MGILHKHKNQVVQDNMFLCKNKLVHRRHVSCHGAMYARVLFSKYRTEAGTKKHIRKLMHTVIDEHYVTDKFHVLSNSSGFSSNSSKY